MAPDLFSNCKRRYLNKLGAPFEIPFKKALGIPTWPHEILRSNSTMQLLIPSAETNRSLILRLPKLSYANTELLKVYTDEKNNKKTELSSDALFIDKHMPVRIKLLICYTFL